MTTMKISIAILTLALCFGSFFTNAQDLDAARVKTMVDSARFIFVAQTMIPSGGVSRPLNTPYDVTLTRDSLVTQLPYIGRAYTGVLPGEAGVNFTSTSFDYKSKFRKKKWEVTIKPKDTKDVRELQFTIFDNGTTTLTLMPTNKQTISYHGYIK